MLNIKLIKRLLKVKHLTQTDFAHKLGVSQSAISHCLMGRVNPTADKLQKMSEILEIPMDSMLIEKANASDACETMGAYIYHLAEIAKIIAKQNENLLSLLDTMTRAYKDANPREGKHDK